MQRKIRRPSRTFILSGANRAFGRLVRADVDRPVLLSPFAHPYTSLLNGKRATEPPARREPLS